MITDDKKSILERVNFFCVFFIWSDPKISHAQRLYQFAFLSFIWYLTCWIFVVSTETSKRICKHLPVVLICDLSQIYLKESSLFSKMVAIRSQPHVSVQAMVRPQFRLVVNHPHSLVDILYIIFLYYLYTLSYIRAR